MVMRRRTTPISFCLAKSFRRRWFLVLDL